MRYCGKDKQEDTLFMLLLLDGLASPPVLVFCPCI